MSKHAEPRLARQSIVDRHRNIVAHELLFRDDASGQARVSDAAGATTQVIALAFRHSGRGCIVGGGAGFVNVDAEMLMSHAIERLPTQSVVLELLESVVIDAAIVDRCAQLKRLGYRLALDDFSAIGEEHEVLLDLVDIVKIDVLQLDDQALVQLVRRLRTYPPRLLAEKVDSPASARHCATLGFDLFQGFYYSRPTMVC